MTITINVYFYTVGEDGVAVKQATGQVTGTSYADIKTQCDQMATDTDWRYNFTGV